MFPGLWTSGRQGRKPLLSLTLRELISTPFRVSHWKLPPCDGGGDGAWVCFDDLKFIPAIIDHEEGVTRYT